MVAEPELIAKVVRVVLEQLTASRREQVLILGSREEWEKHRPADFMGAEQEVHFSPDGCLVEEADRYILPFLGLNDMADLAIGKASTIVAESVRALLLAGKVVEVAAYGYQCGQYSPASPMTQLYRSQDRTLRGFGLRPLAAHVASVRAAGKVVSEQQVKGHHEQGCTRLIVPNNAIVTALANEYAREHGLTIQREQRGNS